VRNLLFLILKSGAVYDNRFVSIAFIENHKIVRWRDRTQVSAPRRVH